MNPGNNIFEDRKTVFAVFLCLMVVMFYSEAFLKVPPPPAPVTSTNSSQQFTPQQSSPEATSQNNQIPQGQANPQLTNNTAASQPGNTQSQTDSLNTNSSTPSLEELTSSGVITVRGAKFEAELSLLGGRLLNYKLTEHTTELESKEMLDLINTGKNSQYPLGLTWSGLQDDHVLYTVAGDTTGVNRSGNVFTLQPEQELRLVLKGSHAQDERTIQKVLVFRSSSNLLGIEAALSSPTQDGSNIGLNWTTDISDEEIASRYNPPQVQWLTAADKVEALLLSEIAEAEEKPGASHWIAIGDKYFTAVLTTQDEQSLSPKTSFAQEGNTYKISITGQQQTGAFELFVGPKQYATLEKLHHDLHRTVDLGFFSFLSLPLLMLINLFYSILGNYGLAIILLTLLIKTVFLPLNVISFRSMKAMQELQPEIKALRERVKDPTQLNQETMSLYKKRGVNPMGGCLPMVLQIPVFFGLYTALLNSVDLRHAPFGLWVTDLSAPESLEIFGYGIPIMLLLMGLSMLLQQLLTPSAMDPQQKKIMLFMPVAFTVMFIIFPFPSGLVLYWLVNNTISIVQQAYLKSQKEVHPLKPTLLADAAIFGFGWVITLL